MKLLFRPLSITLGALATTALGGCYYGDVNSVDYAYSDEDCATRYGDDYYDQNIGVYDDGYGYDCYDASDYRGGFAQIGFSGGWYDNYFYPGYGRYLFDNYNNRYPLRGRYLTYWGGRRAWWEHHGHDKDGRRGGDWQGGHRGDHRDGDRDEHRGGRRGDRSDAYRDTNVTRPGGASAVPPGVGRPSYRYSDTEDSGRTDRGPGVIRRPVPPRNISPDRPDRRTDIMRNAPPPPPAPRYRSDPAARNPAPVARPAISEARDAPARSARQNPRNRERVRPD